jgi:hypothetical protein
VSERLDLVRLIDAKVRVAHVTAARSKTVAILAEEDLADHRCWFERQRQETEATLKEHAARLERERAREARRERRQKLAAEVKSVGADVHRGTASCFVRLRAGFAHGAEALWTGVARSATRLRSGVTVLCTLMWSGLTGAGAKVRTLWPPLMAALASATSWLGIRTRASTIRVAGHAKGSGSQLWQWFSARGTAILKDEHQEVDRPIRGPRERRRRMTPAVIPQRAHQLLQKRIHALDRGQDARLEPVLDRGPEARLEPVLDEWEAFRARARKVQHALEMRQRGIVWSGDGASRAGTTLWPREPQFGMPQAPAPPPRPRRRLIVTHPTPPPGR